MNNYVSIFVLSLNLISFAAGFGYYPKKDELIIRTTCGLVEGLSDMSYYNRQYTKFLGIPYAKPPTGQQRFEPPRLPLPWTGVYKAYNATKCLQLTHVPDPPGGITSGSEDCLHLNVFVPRANVSNLDQLNLDVVVHIHGGAYSFSYGANFRPDFIMDRELILVTLNYRLGIFGFFSTESFHYPGNMALKDQIMALRWVQLNIKRFGGNPNSVLLTGFSAGAGSVHYLTLSPLARGLFHKAHSLSGSALRAMQSEPYEKAKQVGAMLGCSHTNKALLGACLKTRRADQIVEAQRVFRPWLYNPFAPFSAVVDKWSLQPVLPKHPIQLLQEKRVLDIPYISSATSAEGLYPAAEFVYKDEYLAELDVRWNELAPVILNLQHIVPEDQLVNISTLVRNAYFGNENISLQTFPEVIEMMGDRLYYGDIEIGVKLHASIISSPVYCYIFDYLPDKADYAMFLSGKTVKYGVAHGSDVTLYLTTDPQAFGSLTARDERMMNYLLDIWEKFAKDGHLDDWIPVNRHFDSPLYFKYINEELANEMRTTPELGKRKFWESLNIRQTN